MGVVEEPIVEMEPEEDATTKSNKKDKKKKASELNQEFEFAETGETMGSWMPEEELMFLPAKVCVQE